MTSVPIVDVSEIVAGGEGLEASMGIRKACMEHGFFYVVGHGVEPELQRDLERASRAFFEQDVASKMTLRMELAGRAWRGYFPVGGELTSGQPDLKEGLYFGQELPPTDPRVAARVPLHGANLFPTEIAGFRETVLAYMDELARVGHALMRGVALSLGLDADYFRARSMADPLLLFRIFHYPPAERPDPDTPRWGVGEHTDYGVLTILKQDDVGGLQVRTGGGWIDAPPVPGSFVCNIGDMLERLTRGLYRSTPHRVLNLSGRGRFSFPFFFDPGFDSVVEPIALPGAVPTDADARWDGASVHEFEGTYGDYVLAKVAKVFPELAEDR